REPAGQVVFVSSIVFPKTLQPTEMAIQLDAKALLEKNAKAVPFPVDRLISVLSNQDGRQLASELTRQDTRATMPRSIITHSERLSNRPVNSAHFTIHDLRFTIH
ncbi:MAG TPA: hypothetical protein VF961_10185, partial [Pyrinomonadaceae bacterium]